MEGLFTVVKVRVSGGSTYKTTVFMNAMPDAEKRISKFINHPKHQLIEQYQSNNGIKHWKGRLYGNT